MSTPSLALDLAAEVRAEMARQKLSGRRLAFRMGIPPSTLARWTSGETPMGFDEADAVARALNVTISTLLERVPVGPRGDGESSDRHTTLSYPVSPLRLVRRAA